MSKIILGLNGPLAAGKGTIAQYLKNKYAATVYAFSTPLRDILDRIYQPQTRVNMQDLSLDLRNRFGDDLLSSVIAKDATNDKNQIIVVDGVRRLPDIKYLRGLPGFHLITVVTDQKVRWERMVQRDQNPDDTEKTFAQFQKDEQAEAEKHIAEVGQTAEFSINNNGSLDDLYQQIEDILKQVNGD